MLILSFIFKCVVVFLQLLQGLTIYSQKQKCNVTNAIKFRIWFCQSMRPSVRYIYNDNANILEMFTVILRCYASTIF